MLTINLDITYPEIFIAADMSCMLFEAEDIKGYRVLLKIKIEPHPDPLLPGVFNLVFGPLDAAGNIDDKARINHLNPDKTFSTILLFALSYLKSNQVTIGLDGSDDARAYLYHRMFLTNQSYLKEYFATIGVDWYVKLLRNREDIERDDGGHPYFKPRAEPFDYVRRPVYLYRYYMFMLTSVNRA